MGDITDTSDGRLQKMETDYSETVDKKLPICKEFAAQGKLDEALDILLVLEKQTRTGADMHSTARILVAIVQLCFEMEKWDKLNEYIIMLSKRRGQLKQATTKMVQEAMNYIDRTPSLEVKLQLIQTLRTVTEGKIYVEMERARLTRTLATIKENQGDIETASSVLQELQVETFGSMEKREKVEFILEQMRLSLACKDYIRTSFISKKISIQFFQETNTEDLKRKYYELMIQKDLHDDAFLLVCKHYKALYDTPKLTEEKQDAKKYLKSVVVFCVLASFDNEQSDMMHRLLEDRLLIDELDQYKRLLECFTVSELRRWVKFCEGFEHELRVPSGPDSGAVALGEIFSADSEAGRKNWEQMKIRLVEHDLRVISQYYTRITLERMSVLLDLSIKEVEEFLSTLVTNKIVSAKINRLDGIVSFRKKREPNEVLNEWSSNINSLMELVNKSCHLVAKEEMIHKMSSTTVTAPPSTSTTATNGPTPVQ